MGSLEIGQCGKDTKDEFLWVYVGDRDELVRRVMVDEKTGKNIFLSLLTTGAGAINFNSEIPLVDLNTLIQNTKNPDGSLSPTYLEIQARVNLALYKDKGSLSVTETQATVLRTIALELR